MPELMIKRKKRRNKAVTRFIKDDKGHRYNGWYSTPIGLTNHKTFYALVNAAKEELSLNQIYLASNKLQMDKESLVSCGPLCVELIRYLQTLAPQMIIKQLQTGQADCKHGLDFQAVNIAALLPPTLIGMDTENYQEKIRDIRLGHKFIESNASFVSGRVLYATE